MTHPSVDRIGFDFGVGGGGCWGREGGVLGGGGSSWDYGWQDG